MFLDCEERVWVAVGRSVVVVNLVQVALGCKDCIGQRLDVALLPLEQERVNVVVRVVEVADILTRDHLEVVTLWSRLLVPAWVCLATAAEHLVGKNGGGERGF